MIVIEKGSKLPLHKDFYQVNNICAYLYDLIGEVLKDEYYIDMNSTSFEFSGEEDPLKKILDDGELHVFDALAKVGRYSELEISVTKHVVMSIIADMSNFIYESIIVAQKGKMSVAYAILRKPFTDQLLILEQILVDRKDFIDRYFHDGDPKTYDPSSRDIDKRQLIDRAISSLGSMFFQTDVIYGLRYDKSTEFGINAHTNHALHIVTNDKNYKTENQGLNFTFPLIDDDLVDFWEHYYHAVSMLLLYTCEVVDKIVFGLIENKDGVHQLKHLSRFIASMLLFRNEDKDFPKFMYKTLGRILETQCEICSHSNRFTKTDLKGYFWHKLFLCKRCHNPVEPSEQSLEYLGKLFDSIGSGISEIKAEDETSGQKEN